MCHWDHRLREDGRHRWSRDKRGRVLEMEKVMEHDTFHFIFSYLKVVIYIYLCVTRTNGITEHY